MSTTSNIPARNASRAWVIVVMMVIFMMINFADKAVIGLAAGPIMKDLHLTNEQFGQIGSAFFLLFSIAAALVGFLANRIPSKIVLAVMALIWAIAQMPMVGTVSLSTLIASRIALGAGEGPAFPVAVHAVYKWFPNDRRTFPTSFVSIGGPLGLGVVAPLLTWIILTWDWHTAFGFLGVAGFVWLLIWLVVGKEGPLDAHQAEAGAEGLAHVPYSALLLSRTFVGVTLAGFAAYWAVTLAVVWLPSFLIKAGGYSPDSDGLDRHAATTAPGDAFAHPRVRFSEVAHAWRLQSRVARRHHNRLRHTRRHRHDPSLQGDRRSASDPAGHGGVCRRQRHVRPWSAVDR